MKKTIRTKMVAIRGKLTEVVTLNELRRVYRTECIKRGLVEEGEHKNSVSGNQWWEALQICPDRHGDNKFATVFIWSLLKDSLERNGWVADDEECQKDDASGTEGKYLVCGEYMTYEMVIDLMNYCLSIIRDNH